MFCVGYTTGGGGGDTVNISVSCDSLTKLHLHNTYTSPLTFALMILQSPYIGWATDAVLSVDMLLYNGTKITANKDKNSDLFWALRGRFKST